MERSNECGVPDDDVQHRSNRTQQFAQDSQRQVPIRIPHWISSQISTFLQRNVRHLITRNTSPTHTVDAVPQFYTWQLAFWPSKGKVKLAPDSRGHMFKSQPTHCALCHVEYSTVKFIIGYINLVSWRWTNQGDGIEESRDFHEEIKKYIQNFNREIWELGRLN
jgi:hypothetical protein